MANIIVSTDTAAHANLDDAIGTTALSSLTTADKTGLVEAINEVDANADAAQADVDSLQTGATLTAGAEAADVIAVSFDAGIASIEQYMAQIYDTTGLGVAAAFTMVENGVGAEVFGSGTPSLVFTTDAAGLATLDVTDVAGASGKSPLLVVESLSTSADAADRIEKSMLVLTFD